MISKKLLKYLKNNKEDEDIKNCLYCFNTMQNPDDIIELLFEIKHCNTEIKEIKLKSLIENHTKKKYDSVSYLGYSEFVCIHSLSPDKI